VNRVNMLAEPVAATQTGPKARSQDARSPNTPSQNMESPRGSRRLFARIIDAFVPPAVLREGDPRKLHRYRSNLQLTLSVAAALLLIPPYLLIRSGLNLWEVAGFVSMIGGPLAGALLIRFTGNIALAIGLMALNGGLGNTVLTLGTGGLASSFALFSVLGLALTMLTSNGRVVAWVAAMAALNFVVLLVCHLADLVPPFDVPRQEQMLLYFLCLIFAVLLMTRSAIASLRARTISRAALQAARIEAEAATKAKSDFLAMMSHEIRTPMNGVLGLTRLLLNTKLDDEQRGLAATALQSGEALLAILNDILDFSKLEAGRIDLEDIDYDLAVQMQAAIALLAPRAAEKGLRLRHEIAPDLPPYLRGDPGRLRQVLLNLISNAIKFTERGGVTVSADCEGDRLRIRVQDTGIGIAPEQAGKLFARFAQADSSITRRFGGTGLGLAICRALVEAMGGEIGVDSKPGEGSVFWLRLPLREGHAPIARDSLMASRPPLPRLRILVAEDNAVNRKVLGGLLATRSDAGAHDVIFAETGRAALDLAATQDFDLILTDLHMPEMDGIAATRAIRALPPPHGKVKIIAVTSSIGPDGMRRCLEAGMDGFVAKPVNPDALDLAMRRALGLAETGAGIAAGADEVARAADHDPAALQMLVDGVGRKGLAELIDLFFAMLGDVRRELAASMQAGDWPRLARQAHTLRGPSGSLGLNRVLALARQIEAAGSLGAVDAALLMQLNDALEQGCVWLREQRGMLDAALDSGGRTE
jgi:signal transduction histidine kinase/CheY-like chemotaxis protein/HPt (histidine-containing phosphotransfer) domain-containing protein